MTDKEFLEMRIHQYEKMQYSPDYKEYVADYLKHYNSLLKKELAFEVIKKKYVDIEYLMYDCHFERALYNKLMIDDKQLTQEEFDLLCEVLE